MDELSPLFQEIEFHERYRGYDPDEVDAFVDRVARAAAVMRGRLTELHERVEAAESRGGSAVAHSDAEETLTRTLVLAQRTADAAIAEAREEADRLTADAATSAQAILSAAEAEAQLTLREAQSEASTTVKQAEDRAALVLAEAETDRRTMVAEAERTASEAAAAERDRLAAEVAELHEYRAFLADDIEILERHLAEERHQLTASLASLQDLLESPEAFRAGRAPATSGVELDESHLASLVAADDTDAEPGPIDAELVEPELVEPEPAEPDPAAAELVDTEVTDAELVEPEPAATELVEPDPAATELVDTGVTDAAEEPVLAPTFAPADEPEPGEPTIDLVAAEQAAVEDPDGVDEPVPAEDLDRGPEFDPAPVIDRDPGSDGPPSGGEPAYAGRVDRPAEVATVQAAPPRLVTAADLESADGDTTITEADEIAVDDAGPDTEAVPVVHEASLFAEPEVDDDPFLTQLRDAVGAEPEPRGDDDALSAFFDQEEDDGGRTWFGRRR